MNSSYIINNFVFDTESRYLSLGETIVELDPKVADLLIFFLSHPNQILTREQILEKVWADRVVADNTLTWSISQLRKAFNDSASEPKFIKTIPKKGYQFIAVCKKQTNEETPKHLLTYRKPAFFIGCLFIILFVIFLFPTVTKNSQLSVSVMEQLTVLAGREEDGTLSSDHHYLLFRHKPTNSYRFSLMLKPLIDTELVKAADKNNILEMGNRDQPPKILLNDEYNYMSAVWGVNDYQIIAARIADNICQIVSIALAPDRVTPLTVSTLSSCMESAVVSLALNKENQILYFTDIEDNQSHVYALQLGTNQRRLLYKSQQPGLGVRFISQNLAASNLLILEDVERSKTRFINFDNNTGTQSILYEVESVYFKAHFAPDGRNLWLNKGNDKLMQLNVKDGEFTPIIQASFGWNYNLNPQSEDIALVSVSDSNSRDLGIWRNGNKVVREKTIFNEWVPTLAPSGEQLAFVSNQTGIPQIWLEDLKTGDKKQVSTLSNYREFQGLEWSPDGRWLLGATQGELGIIDLSNGEFRSLYSSKSSIMYPSWDNQSRRILFSQNTLDGWTVNSIDIQHPGYAELLIDNAWMARSYKQGVLFSRPHMSGLFYQADDSTVPVFQQVPENAFWRMSSEGLFFSTPADVSKIFYIEDETKEPRLHIKHEARLSEKFTMQGDLIVAEAINFSQSDIKIVFLE